MFGLRSRYALTNFFIANLRQNLYFALRAGRLQGQQQADPEPRPALRVRLARSGSATTSSPTSTPRPARWCGPATAPRPRARERRPATTSARGSASPTPSTPKTVLRGGYGIAYIHFHRAGGGNVLPINGPQVITAVVSQANPADPAFRPTQAGLPRGPHRPQPLQPPAREHHLHAAATTRRPRSRAGSSPCSASSSSNVVLDLAYVGNHSERLAALRELQPGAAQQRAGTIPPAGAAPDPGVRRHHLRVQRRLLALQQLPGAPGGTSRQRSPS